MRKATRRISAPLSGPAPLSRAGGTPAPLPNAYAATVLYHRAPEFARREEKLRFLAAHPSALEWIIDQYQLTTNKTTGEPSDSNRPDQPQYIVELIERVVHNSLKTNAVVAG